MNIGVGKFGKAIAFDKNRWGSIGGDNECPTLIVNLFHSWPKTKFFILSKSDYGRLSEQQRAFINKNNNVIDCWQGYTRDTMAEFWLDSRMNDTELDSAIMYSGPTGTSSIRGVSRLMNGELATILESHQGYVGPLVWFFNQRPDLKYVVLNVDPRYFPMRSKDLNNRPAINLGQKVESITRKIYSNYAPETECEVTETLIQKQIESVFLIGRKLLPDNHERDIEMTVLMNNGLGRWDETKRFLIDTELPVDIYGKWPEEIYDEYINVHPPIQFDTLKPTLIRTKYTFMIPIKQGWVTAKYLEMAYFGIIPFLHHTYGETTLPDFCYVKTPQELKDKISILNQNSDMHKRIKIECIKRIRHEFMDGSYMRTKLLEALTSLGVDIHKESVDGGMQNQTSLW